MYLNARCIGFIGILLWSIIMNINTHVVLDTDSTLCNVCLSWKIIKPDLILTCKVRYLNAIVQFTYSGEDMGLCYPPYPNASCETPLKFGNLQQNNVTNETILSINYFKSDGVDGSWTCQKGEKEDRVEVKTSITKYIPEGLECLVYIMLFNLVGFTIVSLVFITLCICKNGMLQTPDTLVKCVCCQRLTSSPRIFGVVVALFFVGIMCIPALIGYFEQKQCPVPAAFICYGAVASAVGMMLICILHNDKETDDSNVNEAEVEICNEVNPQDIELEEAENDENAILQ